MKTALITGAAGFIGGHLAKKLKQNGYWVRGVDIVYPRSEAPVLDYVDEFWRLDLRKKWECGDAFSLNNTIAPGPFDEVYQLAATFGGMGFIEFNESNILSDNTAINYNMLTMASITGVSRYLFTSSVCIYRDMQPGEPPLTEEEAYPANPDNEYGWEKLYAERMATVFGKHTPGFETRIARLQNTYGIGGDYKTDRAKAPGALCYKVAKAEAGGSINVWGDGSAVRAYTYVDDTVEGIYRLMQSDITQPTNIGGDEYVTVAELAGTIIDASGKDLGIRYVDGPVGVASRNFSKDRLKSLGWEAKVTLKDGVERTYNWIKEQVNGRE